MKENKLYRNLSTTIFKNSLFCLIVILLFSCNSGKEGDLQKVEDTFFSKSLNEDRTLTLYFPKNFDAKVKYDVVYATDGQLINKDYHNELDQLIEKGDIAPIVIVGVNSNEKEASGTGLEYRNFEYAKNLTDDAVLSKLYDKHNVFFTEEVEQYMQEKYKLIAAKKIFYGASNGAGYGFNLLCQSQNKFDVYLLYSIAGADTDSIDNIQEINSLAYISYGNKEPIPLIENIEQKILKLKNKNYPVYVDIFEGGHSRDLWKKQFFQNLKALNIK